MFTWPNVPGRCVCVVFACAGFVGCTGGDAGKDEGADDDAASASTPPGEPDSTATEDPSDTDPTGTDSTGTGATDTDPTAADPTDDGTGPVASDSGPDTEPSTSTGSREPVAPGNPEVLLADLALPGRVAFDADGIVLIDHRHYLGGDPDNLIRVSKSGDSVEILASAPSIEGFVLNPDRIWINSYANHSVMAISRSSGQIELEAVLDASQSPTQMVDTGTHLLVAVTPRLAVIEIDKASLAQRELWASGTDGSAIWVQKSTDSMILPANLAGNPSTVVVLPFDGADAQLIAQASGLLRGLTIDGSDVVYADSEAGVFRVPLAGGAANLISKVTNPWGVLVDGDTLYVSSQPEYCDDTKLGAVYAAPVSGGEPVQLASDQRCPSGLLADDDALYWVNNGDSTAATDSTSFAIVPNGSLVKLPR